MDQENPEAPKTESTDPRQAENPVQGVDLNKLHDRYEQQFGNRPQAPSAAEPMMPTPITPRSDAEVNESLRSAVEGDPNDPMSQRQTFTKEDRERWIAEHQSNQPTSLSNPTQTDNEKQGGLFNRITRFFGRK